MELPVTQTAARPADILAGNARFLIATAGRAPSVHNTQPWRFRIGPEAVELYCDPRRKLRADPAGREMVISCGAALFGLRLAIRSLGYQPVVDLLPDPSHLRLMARVGVGAAAPMDTLERQMLAAVPHRHTHRGPFTPGPLPAGLLAALRRDADDEGCLLVPIDDAAAFDRVAGIAAAATRRGNLDPIVRADTLQWTRSDASRAKDGMPATAIADPQATSGRLPQRDLDLGRGLGRLPAGGAPPAATALLLTRGDRRADWLRAGQALHRLLLHAATRWVFASLYSQPLEDPVTRELICGQLALPGSLQMLLQLGHSASAASTSRRAADDLTDP